MGELYWILLVALVLLAVAIARLILWPVGHAPEPAGCAACAEILELGRFDNRRPGAHFPDCPNRRSR